MTAARCLQAPCSSMKTLQCTSDKEGTGWARQAAVQIAQGKAGRQARQAGTQRTSVQIAETLSRRPREDTQRIQFLTCALRSSANFAEKMNFTVKGEAQEEAKRTNK